MMTWADRWNRYAKGMVVLGAGLALAALVLFNKSCSDEKDEKKFTKVSYVHHTGVILTDSINVSRGDNLISLLSSTYSLPKTSKALDDLRVKVVDYNAAFNTDMRVRNTIGIDNRYIDRHGHVVKVRPGMRSDNIKGDVLIPGTILKNTYDADITLKKDMLRDDKGNYYDLERRPIRDPTAYVMANSGGLIDKLEQLEPKARAVYIKDGTITLDLDDKKIVPKDIGVVLYDNKIMAMHMIEDPANRSGLEDRIMADDEKAGIHNKTSGYDVASGISSDHGLDGRMLRTYNTGGISALQKDMPNFTRSQLYDALNTMRISGNVLQYSSRLIDNLPDAQDIRRQIVSIYLDGKDIDESLRKIESDLGLKMSYSSMLKQADLYAQSVGLEKLRKRDYMHSGSSSIDEYISRISSPLNSSSRNSSAGMPESPGRYASIGDIAA